jgi:uncharacterized protein YfiM (DUF2279 family)
VAEGDPVTLVGRGFVVVVVLVVVSSRARASGCTELVGETFLSPVMMIVSGKQIGSDRGHWRERRAQWRRAPWTQL